MKRRVIFIDSENRDITETTVSSLKDCQNLVGGLIERGHILDNGDELYVNEEGLLGDPRRFFKLDGAHQPFAGNAYIIGEVTGSGNNKNAKTTLEEAAGLIKFFNGRHV